MNKNMIKNELNKKCLFEDKFLIDEVNDNDININKLYNEFIKFRSSLEIMTSKEYGKKYSRFEFVQDIKEFTLYNYNGCFIEYNKNPRKFYVPLYNSGFEGILSDCEIYLFIHFYIYECIGLDNLK